MRKNVNGRPCTRLPIFLSAVLATITAYSAVAADPIIHDAEYYILEAQNGKVWQVE